MPVSGWRGPTARRDRTTVGVRGHPLRFGPLHSRLVRRALFVVALLGVFAVAALPALAEGETIQGILRAVDGDETTPVEGVVITVFSGDETVGQAVSGPDGAFSVPLPAEGTYGVRLDPASLPEGVGLTDPTKSELPNVRVRAGQLKTVRFQLGPGRVVDVNMWERVGELTVIGLKLGAIIALSAIGLSLIFGVTGLVNFAHGELVTLGALLTWWFNTAMGLHLALAAVPGVLAVAAFGGVQERWLWRPLRARRTGNIAMIVIAIGLSLFLRYGAILVPFGGLPRPFRQYVIQTPMEILGLSIVPKNLVIIGASALILTAVGLMLQKTQIGMAMRAVADNADLARSSGINVDKVVLVTWIVGGGLAALGGVFFGVSEIVEWEMGFKLLLLIFSGVVLGGLGTAYGAMLGGFVVGLAVELSTLVLPVEFKQVVALLALVVMLLFRPQGLLGRKERIG